MLNLINNLEPFFEDCYKQIGVREYAKLAKISPPTASKLLKSYDKQGILISHTERRYLLFQANKENKDFIDLTRLYWRKKLAQIIDEMQKKLANPTAILFGSLAKAENKQDSDVDIAIFAPDKKTVNTEPCEAKLGREISIQFFKSLNDIKNKNLLNNILNGYVLFGRIEL